MEFALSNAFSKATSNIALTPRNLHLENIITTHKKI